MKKKQDTTKSLAEQATQNEKSDIQKKLTYPPSEDIYNKDQEEENIDPEDTAKIKAPNEDWETENNEKIFDEDVSGSDLDVPGSELDDDREKDGEEDKENNYYSLGGDSHNDLEEDKGD